MARSPRLALSLMVGFALAVPVLAWGQAVPRTAPPPSSGSSGSGSSGGSTGSSGTSGSSSSGSSSTSSGGSTHTPSRIPSSGSSSASSRSRSVEARTAPTPGGVVTGAATSRTGSDPGPTTGVTQSSSSYDPLGARARGRSGGAGTAGVRPATDVSYISFPFFGPWGRWYPWFGSGFGWYPGFVSYDPWRYGATRWGWGRYGLWYDPYSYYYDPYYYGGGPGYYSSGTRETKVKDTTGGIRLKVSPGEARVYIDGVLQGTVDEFDGLAGHLTLEGGRHTLELRADGYETVTREITVEAGRTLTERVTLKKK